LRPLTRLEHEQKSGVISVYFILAEALNKTAIGFGQYPFIETGNGELETSLPIRPGLQMPVSRSNISNGPYWNHMSLDMVLSQMGTTRKTGKNTIGSVIKTSRRRKGTWRRVAIRLEQSSTFD